MFCHSIVRVLLCSCFLWVCLAEPAGAEPDSPPATTLFAKDNLVAWCIVPFDANKRTPAERAAMVKRLGLKKVAYDWRKEHVSTFEEEILAYRNNGLEFFAFWSWHPSMEALIQKHKITPQLWRTCPSPPLDTTKSLTPVKYDQQVAAVAKQLLPEVQRAKRLGCRYGLYNHGGWGGEPENLVAVCEYLHREHNAAHVGIVYNFHHGHGHIKDFARRFALMKPYLLCVNINGMNPGANPKILPVGSGQHEQKMLQVVIDSGYRGPIGILDHRNELDAETSLRQNLDGLAELLPQLPTPN